MALEDEKNFEIIQEILKFVVDINYMNKNGDTPKFKALSVNVENLDVIKKLLKKRASVMDINVKGETPLHIALQTGKSLETIYITKIFR